MSKVFLIRHGQASLGKDNYDALSDNGFRQATLLGKYFCALGITPDIVISGNMTRHQQTARTTLAELTGSTQIQIDDRWNEFDFEALLRAFIAQQDPEIAKPKTPSSFFSALRRALIAWSNDEIERKLPETWTDFESRVTGALTNLHAQSGKTIFVFSSGGTISMVVKKILGLSAAGMVDLNLQSRNTGITELFLKDDRAHLSCLNHVAHLSTSENQSLITHA